VPRGAVVVVVIAAAGRGAAHRRRVERGRLRALLGRWHDATKFHLERKTARRKT
jgi:hypothetical protein